MTELFKIDIIIGVISNHYHHEMYVMSILSAYRREKKQKWNIVRSGGGGILP